MISATNLGWFQQNEVLNILGIFPIAETLFPQVVLVIITIVTFVVQIKRNRDIAKEAEGTETAASVAAGGSISADDGAKAVAAANEGGSTKA